MGFGQGAKFGTIGAMWCQAPDRHGPCVMISHLCMKTLNMNHIIRTAAIILAATACTLTMAQQEAPDTDLSNPPARTEPVKGAPATAPSLDARNQQLVEKPVADGFRPMNLGLLIKQLGLSPKQQEDTRELNARYMKMYRSLPEAMPLEDRRTKVKSLMEERDAAFKAFLDKGQVEQYGQLLTPTGAKVSPTAEPTK